MLTPPLPCCFILHPTNTPAPHFRGADLRPVLSPRLAALPRTRLFAANLGKPGHLGIGQNGAGSVTSSPLRESWLPLGLSESWGVRGWRKQERRKKRKPRGFMFSLCLRIGVPVLSLSWNQPLFLGLRALSRLPLPPPIPLSPQLTSGFPAALNSGWGQWRGKMVNPPPLWWYFKFWSSSPI